MNYDFEMDYKYGFECPTHHGSPCVLDEEAATCMHCVKDTEEIFDLQPLQKLWFTLSKSDGKHLCEVHNFILNSLYFGRGIDFALFL